MILWVSKMRAAVLLRLREVERFGAGAVVTAPRVDLAVTYKGPRIATEEILNVSCFDGLLVYLLSIV